MDIIDGPAIVAQPLRPNGALRDWAHEQGLRHDRTAGPDGERFGCRYEAYLTDPRTEPRKTRWQTETGHPAGRRPVPCQPG